MDNIIWIVIVVAAFIFWPMLYAAGIADDEAEATYERWMKEREKKNEKTNHISDP